MGLVLNLGLYRGFGSVQSAEIQVTNSRIQGLGMRWRKGLRVWVVADANPEQRNFTRNEGVQGIWF